MNTNELILLQREKEYRSWHQKRADDIDETVDYMRTTQRSWGYEHFIVEWDDVTSKVLTFTEKKAPAKGVIEIAGHLLATGEWDGIRIDIDDIYKNMGGWNLSWPKNGTDLKNVKEAYIRRLFYAHLAIDSPETFEILHQNDIIGFHGTQAITLPSIIEQASLLSHAEQYRLNILTGSGEAHPADIRRKFISFGSVQDLTAFRYAESDLRSDTKIQDLQRAARFYEGYQLRIDEVAAFDKQLRNPIEGGDTFIEYADAHRFGIILGLARKAIWCAGIDNTIGEQVEVRSDINEVCFVQKVGLDYIPTLFVGEEHREQVSQIVPEGLAVFSKDAIERAQRKAYQSLRANSPVL